MSLTGRVKDLVTDEYREASEKFGPTNNSPHESYAVILEEYQEAKEESRHFKYYLNSYWGSVKRLFASNCVSVLGCLPG